jgi:hypothetical protein
MTSKERRQLRAKRGDESERRRRLRACVESIRCLMRLRIVLPIRGSKIEDSLFVWDISEIMFELLRNRSI